MSMQQLCRRLLTSAKDDEADTIRGLVSDMKVDPNFQNPMGQSALHIAAIWGSKNAAEALLDLGANINIRNQPMLGCQTPLHLSVRRERYAFALFLVKKGCKVQLRDARGEQAWESCKDVTVAGLIGAPNMELLEAAKDGNLEKIQKLCSSGEQNLSQQNSEGYTALQLVCQLGRLDCVKVLLGAKASPDCSDKLGAGPLHIAAHSNNAELARMLVEAGCDLNLANLSTDEVFQGNFIHKFANGDKEELESIDKTPLVVALEEEHDEVAEFLIKAKADVNVPDAEGLTPLHHSMENDNVEMMQLLLEHKADPEASNGIMGDDNTCLGYAVSNGELEQAQVLLKHACNVNAVCKGGMCPIHLAARRGHQGLCELLIDVGKADPTGPDKSGRTALDLAKANKRDKLIPYLEKVVSEMTNW